MGARRPATATFLGLAISSAGLLGASGAAGRGVTIPELVEAADIEALAAAPDGRKVAFRVVLPSLQANSYSIHWHVADLATGRTRRIGDGGAPIYNDGAIEAEAPIWSPDSRFLYHRALVDGAIGVWRTAADGSGSAQAIGGDADIERVEPAGEGGLFYVTGPTRAAIRRAERREYDEGILVDESVDLAQSLFRGGFVHGRLASQRLVGRWYQRDGLLWREPRTRWRFDFDTMEAGTGELLPQPKVEPLRQATSLASLSASSPAGDVATAAERETGGWDLDVRRPSGDKLRCAAAACRTGRVVALAWRPGHDALLFTTQDGHFRQSLHAWRPATGRVRTVVRGEGLLSGGRHPSLPCALTAEHAVCVTAAAASPPKLERIDLDTGRRAILFDPNAELRARGTPAVEHLSWSLPGGSTATGTLLYKPDGRRERAPLFVNYYYCPGFLRGGIGDEFPFLPLVEAGFVVACLNMVRFDDSRDGVDRYRMAQRSVERLVELLGRRGMVDPRRVGMGGFSAGGEATMWLAMNSSLLAAAAIASPQYEPSSFWLGAVRGRDHEGVMRSFLQIGSPDEDPERWRLISPALNADRIRVPLLMQLPEQEARSAIELYSRLSNTLTPVELHAYPDEGHVKIQPRHRHAVYRRNRDWFRYWLQGHVDPSSDRAEQYRRWDDLRRRRHAQPRCGVPRACGETP